METSCNTSLHPAQLRGRSVARPGAQRHGRPARRHQEGQARSASRSPWARRSSAMPTPTFKPTGSDVDTAQRLPRTWALKSSSCRSRTPRACRPCRPQARHRDRRSLDHAERAKVIDFSMPYAVSASSSAGRRIEVKSYADLDGKKDRPDPRHRQRLRSRRRHAKGARSCATMTTRR